MSDNVAIAAVIAFKAIIKTAKFKMTTFKEAAFKATAVQTNVWQCCNRRNNSLSIAFQATFETAKTTFDNSSNIALKHLLKHFSWNRKVN